MSPSQISFDLTSTPWLPVSTATGGTALEPLDTALTNAQSISELRDPSPLVTAALHRLLLAILHRALGGPKNRAAWAELWKAGRFPAQPITAYLAKWSHRFDLFDTEHPFYQVGGFELDDTRAVTQLAQEFAGGNNPTLFDHTHELSADSWPPEVCARWLVANQAFALGGGVGPVSKMFGKHPNLLHAPLVGGALALLRGDNLFQTLMLNLLVYNEEEPCAAPNGLADDVPAWERDRPIAKLGTRTCLGWLDLLTWQSRCICLIPEDGRVRTMFYAQGEGLDQRSRPIEPMWFHRANDEQDDIPIRLDPDRALWRSSDSLFAFSVRTDKKETRPRAFSQVLHFWEQDPATLGGRGSWRCSLLGLANDKAKVLLWAHEELPVPVRLLKDGQAINSLHAGLRASEDAGRALRSALFLLGGKLLAFDPGDSGRTADTKLAAKKGESLQGMPYYWTELELPFKEFLNALGGDSETDAPLEEWQRKVRKTAVKAFHQAAENSLGRSARELKARVDAEHFLNALLKNAELGKEVLEEVKHG